MINMDLEIFKYNNIKSIEPILGSSAISDNDKLKLINNKLSVRIAGLDNGIQDRINKILTLDVLNDRKIDDILTRKFQIIRILHLYGVSSLEIEISSLEIEKYIERIEKNIEAEEKAKKITGVINNSSCPDHKQKWMPERKTPPPSAKQQRLATLDKVNNELRMWHRQQKETHKNDTMSPPPQPINVESSNSEVLDMSFTDRKIAKRQRLELELPDNLTGTTPENPTQPPPSPSSSPIPSIRSALANRLNRPPKSPDSSLLGGQRTAPKKHPRSCRRRTRSGRKQRRTHRRRCCRHHRR